MNGHNNPTTDPNTGDNAIYPFKKEPRADWERVLKKVKANKNRAGVLAKEFINQVEKNFKEQHSLLFYATKMNITKSYLRKICQRAIGMPPSHCIRVRLMLEARELLKSSGLSIKEVAFSLGFQDASHFSKFFKKNDKVSPDGYRSFHQGST